MIQEVTEQGLQIKAQSIFASGKRGSRLADECHLHVMISSYFDDSSDDKRQEYFAVAGVLADENHWHAFEADWREATKALKEPFRSTDCECQHKQFASWRKEDCDALMARLVDIMVDCRIGGFGAIIPIADFLSVFPNLTAIDAYLLGVEHTIVNMAHLAAKTQEDIEFWWEKGTASKLAIDGIFDKTGHR